MVGWQGVDSVSHTVLISDTTLRSFIPSQVRKMNPKICQICGCELCTILKDMQIYLNRIRTILVTDLQQNSVGRNTWNSLFSNTRNAHYKLICFQIVNFYMILSKMMLNASPVLLLNQIIWFISSLIWFFVMNFLSKIFPMKNQMMDQMLQ